MRNDRKKGGRRQRKRSMAVEDSDTDQHKSDADDDSSSSSGEEDGLDDSGEDEGHHNTAARILSSHQFHLLWSTPISPPALPPTPTPHLLTCHLTNQLSYPHSRGRPLVHRTAAFPSTAVVPTGSTEEAASQVQQSVLIELESLAGRDGGERGSAQ